MSKEKNRFRQTGPWWRWLIVVLILIVLFLSAILSWHSITGETMTGCGHGNSCGSVFGSRWSMLAGVFPVSGLALGVYLALLVAVFFIGSDTEISIRRQAWTIILVLSGSIFGSAIWFTIIQKQFIGEFCLYCMVAHIIGILITGLVIWRITKEKVISRNFRKPLLRQWQIILSVLVGLALAGLLAAVQIHLTPSGVNQKGNFQEDSTILDLQDIPLSGSPDAPHKVILLFDYQCFQCQKIHFMLDEVIRRHEGKLAFALCPTPLSKSCNQHILKDIAAFNNSCDLARIGLSVWYANREVFPEFEDWMFSFETGSNWRPRTVEEAQTKAIELLGQNQFEVSKADPRVEQSLQNSVRIYGQIAQGGNGSIPKMIYGSRWITPEPYNADELDVILQKGLLIASSH